MALLIERKIELRNGLEINQAYVRIKTVSDFGGVNVKIETLAYPSKELYLANKTPVELPNLSSLVNVFYDRERDGNDMLAFAHNTIKDILTEDEVERIRQIDSSGNVTEEVVSIGPWVQDSSISIVDISIG